MKYFLICFILVCTTIGSMSAQGRCGMSAADQLTPDFYEATRMVNEGLVQFRSATTYVPVRFNLIGLQTDPDEVNTSFLRRGNALDQIWSMNQYYVGQEIHFYLNERNVSNSDETLFTLLENDVAYTNPGEFIARSLFNSNRDTKAMNLYIVENIPPSDNTAGTILGYYSPELNGSRDWIVQLKRETNGTTTTLAHEAGHYFSVAHPHRGWECDPWGNSNETAYTPAPVITHCSPPTINTEYADGRNCTNSADNLCDTPADYNGLLWPCAPFTDDRVQDPDGVGIRPMYNNIMSYFGGCTEYFFTQNQKEQIIANYESTAREYLRPGLTPPLDDITVQATAIAPVDTVKMMNGTDVTLSWDAVPNAAYYLIYIGRCNENGSCVNSFSTGFQQYITTDTELTLSADVLQHNRRYYWNVRPFNTHYMDPSVTSEIEIFRTSLLSDVNDIDGLNKYTISPNPVRHESSFALDIDSDHNLTEAVITIRDIGGKKVHERKIGNISSGQNRFDIHISNLANGVYAVTLSTHQGIKTSKLAKIE